MLSRLPPSWAVPTVRDTLSIDCQTYSRCRACGWEQRINLWDVIRDEAERGAWHCTRCGKPELETEVHRLHAPASCEDCGAVFELALGAEPGIECPACGSANVRATGEAEITPPFPDRFGDLRTLSLSLTGDPEHTWGASAVADAQQIMAESHQVAMLPEAHRFNYALLAFARRLRGQLGEDSDWEDRYWLSNVAGNLSQDYFRAVGALDVGIAALDDFRDMVALAPDDVNRAIAQHSYAMAVFSLLARYPEDYVAALAGRDEIRADALSLAADAAHIIERYAEDEGTARQLARVRWVMGDLLLVGAADDEERRAAIACFDAASTNEWLSQRMGFAIRTSRATAILRLVDPGQERFDQAIEDLRLASEAGGSDDAYSYQWRPSFLLAGAIWRHGGREHAISPMERSAALALQQVTAMGDEVQLLYLADQLVEVFETLAAIYVDVGWVDEALSAIEVMRAISIRLYTIEGEARDVWFEEIKARQLEDLWPATLKDAKIQLDDGQLVPFPSLSPRVSQRPIDDYFEENPIGPAVMGCLNHHSDMATGLVSLFLHERRPGDWVAAALVCRMVDSEHWENNRLAWRPDPEALERLRRMTFVEPGPFRERLLAHTCRLATEALFAPVLEAVAATDLQRLIVSMPGTFGRLPLEALGPGALNVINLPSVRIGVDLAGPAPSVPRDYRDARVLVVGYDGPDMPEQETEVAHLRTNWGDRLTVLPGPECTKRNVLGALNGAYDIVHLICHGTYEWAVPLRSAMHFSPRRDDDGRRVTAADLLRHVRLRERPLVVMSACSSGITADSRTNSFHGLVGSLFRRGARGIIGSRWPVDDKTAAELMGSLHERLRSTGDAADVCLHQARYEFREAGSPIEGWAAFAYFGVA